MELTRINFRTTVFENNSRIHSVYFEPTGLIPQLNSVLVEYRNSKMVEVLISEMKSGLSLMNGDLIETGSNETFIRIYNHEVIFDMEYVTELQPMKLMIKSAIDLFEKYLVYLIKYENGHIPGLIPAEKLNEWRLVPIHQIREEYLKFFP